MRRLVGAVAVALAVLGAAACTNSTGLGGRPITTLPTVPGGVKASDLISPDPPPEAMVSAPAANENLAVLQRLSQRSNVCEVVGGLSGGVEPDPHDIDELIAAASRATLVITFLDPNSKVRDEQGRPDRLPAPEQMMQRVEQVRQSLVAYSARLGYAKALLGAGAIDEATQRRWLDYYFVMLVNSPYSEAMNGLVGDWQQYC